MILKMVWSNQHVNYSMYGYRRAKSSDTSGWGENIKLQARSQSADWKLNITYEYTARDTPQQNHLAEVGFALLANKA